MFPAPPWMNPAQAASYEAMERQRELGMYHEWLNRNRTMYPPGLPRNYQTVSSTKYSPALPIEFRVGDRVINSMGMKGKIVAPWQYRMVIKSTPSVLQERLVLFDGYSIPTWVPTILLHRIVS